MCGAWRRASAVRRFAQMYASKIQSTSYSSLLSECVEPPGVEGTKALPNTVKASSAAVLAKNPVSTSVFCLPGDEVLLSKKLARKLEKEGVPGENIEQLRQNPYIVVALCKSFVRYTRFAKWIGNYGIVDPGDISSIVIRRPMLLTTPLKYLEKNMQRYGMMDIEQKELGKLALSNPAILAFDHKMLVAAIKHCRKIGIKDMQLGEMVVSSPAIFSPRFNIKLEATIQWLIRELGLGSQKIRKAILHSPWLVNRRLEELDRMKKFFRNDFGLSVERLKQMAHRNPGWIGVHLDKQVIPMVAYLKSEYRMTGPVIGNMFASQPGLLVKPLENMKANREYLMSLGASADDMINIALKSPTALYIDLDQSLKLKMEFLQEELKRSAMDIVKCPEYLACRLNIILLRSAFLGPDRKSVKLIKLVDQSTEKFAMNTAKSTVKIFEKFSSQWIVPPKWRHYYPFPEVQAADDESDDDNEDPPKPAVYREGEKGYW